MKENILLKVKEFKDDEAIVVGYQEKVSNQREAVYVDGYLTRPGVGREGFVMCDTLGSFILEFKGQTMRCGSGLNDEMRAEVWANQDTYLGKMVKFKYMAHGVKDLPRHPIFLGFRDPDDLDAN